MGRRRARDPRASGEGAPHPVPPLLREPHAIRDRRRDRHLADARVAHPDPDAHLVASGRQPVTDTTPTPPRFGALPAGERLPRLEIRGVRARRTPWATAAPKTRPRAPLSAPRARTRKR